MRRILAAILASCVAGSTAEAGFNLVADGGFESGGFSPAWTTTNVTVDDPYGEGPAAFEVDQSFPHSGDFAAHYQILGIAFRGTATLSQTLATVAGQHYVLDFFANRRMDRRDQSTIQVSFGGQAVTADPVPIVDTFDYVRYTYVVQATGTSTDLEIDLAFALGLGGGSLRIDDVSVTAVVPEPSSLALCGVGALGGLGYARSRRRAA